MISSTSSDGHACLNSTVNLDSISPLECFQVVDLHWICWGKIFAISCARKQGEVLFKTGVIYITKETAFSCSLYR